MAESLKESLSFTKSNFKPRTPDVSSLAYERLQPQAIELEEAVLGAVMLDKDAISIVLDILKPESFYKPANQKIYQSMIRLFETNQPIDTLTIREILHKTKLLEEIGGLAYILELANKVASSANLEYHAKIVAQKFVQRELIKNSTAIIQDCFEDTKDVFDLLDSAEQGLYDITDNYLRRGYESVGSLVRKAQQRLENMTHQESGMSGIPSGFPELDELTSGWQKSNLIIVAARPGMGKTSFTLALARNAAMDYNTPVALFSLEMNNLELVNRLISMEAEIEGGKMRNAKLDDEDWTKLNQSINKLSDAPIYIDDTPSLNVFELRAKCRRLHQQYKIGMVIIDYLQLMTVGSNDKKGSREQEISTISRALKSLAKEINIPVIALSQLNRAAETQSKENKRPQLSNLRESGAIEQDADMVMFIYRPDYYELENTFEMPKGYTELIIAKHRNGATGTVGMKFIDKFAKFVPLQQNFDPFGSVATPNVIIKQSKMNDEEDIPF
ncbi:MAG: replicative DNA helicase [Saprospiraceae bacterium]|nr:replicative DNA helicase [Saprospiraceae bacterium]MBK8485288.1 replicative DNA helicase [Saprospiraceae bacterium]MBK9222506.1 replicative DNA helicase [Saprospiraceae bacterium]MBK9720461.1 replicative DNA helicase [Saprospiraceae bacterium]MBK9727432.1 replicative DNA helicase [Saprospiraceae bacterium]